MNCNVQYLIQLFTSCNLLSIEFQVSNNLFKFCPRRKEKDSAILNSGKLEKKILIKISINCQYNVKNV